VAVAAVGAINPTRSLSTGGIQVTNVLSSPRTVKMGIDVMRAFRKRREFLAPNRELARRLAGLDARIERPLATRDAPVVVMRSAIRQLMNVATQANSADAIAYRWGQWAAHSILTYSASPLCARNLR
jgi:hypothetical protein